jgi:hypothetical protein
MGAARTERNGWETVSVSDDGGTLHPQDRLLIVEALAYWASGHGSLSRRTDTADRRAHRAAELAEGLLDAGDVEGGFRDAIDADWNGAERNDGEGGALTASESTGGEFEEADV